jgi:type IV secretory pathway TrbF-like protein
MSTASATPNPETAATNGDVPAAWLAELKFLETAYAQLQARDGRAESHARAWKAAFFASLVITLGVGLWDHLDRRTALEAFVQVVQVTEEGRVLSLGVPQPVLEYSPEDSHWFGTLGEWVTKVRQRGDSVPFMKQNWRWAYLHTCGPATKFLHDTEAADKPFENTGRQVMVRLLGWNKTLAPLSYHLHWEEDVQQPGLPIQRQRYNGIFTVGRVNVTDQTYKLLNPYGMCITSYSISPEAR